MKNHNVSTGMSFSAVLLIVFITLKLTNIIAWSWWWVLAPFWMPVAILGVLALIWVIFMASNR